ncbi:MAG: bifunctional DNA primase/polymerase, partial [Bacilli bacterium]
MIPRREIQADLEAEGKPGYIIERKVPLEAVKISEEEGIVNVSTDPEEKACGITIPEALAGCRFIKVRPRDKPAIEKGWQEGRNYSIDDPELLQHLNAGGNYGVIPADGICILDADEAPRMMDLLEPFLDTYTVRTGGDGTKFHFYFRCNDLEGKVPFYAIEDGTHLGEIYGSRARAYCVGPGCTHPSGRTYAVVRDLPLKEIPIEVLDEKFFARVKSSRSPAADRPDTTPAPASSPQGKRVPVDVSVGGTITDQLGLSVEEFMSPLKPKPVGDEIHGEHPVHGSSTGSNFQINRLKNSWVCWRCNSGGGPLEALAVAEGIIRCDQAGPNCLDNHWPEIFDALRKRGHNVVSKNDARRGIVLRRSKNPIKAAEARDVLGCIARTLRLQNMREDETLDQVAKINASRRMEEALSDEAVLEVVQEAYQAITISGARQKTELARKTPPELQDAAEKILQDSGVLAYFREVFGTLHSEDLPILDSILCGFATMSCVNTNGIQPAVNGPLGGGKTSGVKAALHLAPPERVFKTSLSSKALFYDDRLRPGIAIFSDDTTLEENLMDTIKRAMSNYQEATEHLTVEKTPSGNKARSLLIPPRIMYLFTAVGDTGDDQLCDRQYMISVDPTPQGDEKFLDFLVGKLLEGREEYPVTDDVLVCREILRNLGAKIFRVRIPWAERVEFRDRSRRRNIGSFFDYCIASAILNHRNRPQGFTPGDEEGVVTLDATEEDFLLAREVFRYNQDTRAYDLNKEERALLDWLLERDLGDGVTETEIIRDFRTRSGSPWSRGKVRGILYGYRDQGGLMQKVPGMWYEGRLIEYGERSRRQVNVIFTPKVVGSRLSDYEDWVRL